MISRHMSLAVPSVLYDIINMSISDFDVFFFSVSKDSLFSFQSFSHNSVFHIS